MNLCETGTRAAPVFTAGADLDVTTHAVLYSGTLDLAFPIWFVFSWQELVHYRLWGQKYRHCMSLNQVH